MAGTALIQVLGAIAYGEHKAYDKATERARSAIDAEERRMWRTIAAEELRHHKGFVRRLVALGADPDRAMAPYRASLDRFHSMAPEPDEIRAAVLDLLGEGIASDLLSWLRRVADPDTAAFVDTVIADEVGHEGRAAAEVRRLMADAPDGRRRGSAAARQMVLRMASSGGRTGVPFTAFVRLGRAHELVGALAGGYTRRLRMLGIEPWHTLGRFDVLGVLGAAQPAA
ncbi:MAG TPA: ferritin-like fold-containing protein [Acidimicrobiales bacterium]|nr:ferritin-like fold-containing protein [Acidimicrobiales bacterium]